MAFPVDLVSDKSTYFHAINHNLILLLSGSVTCDECWHGYFYVFYVRDLKCRSHDDIITCPNDECKNVLLRAYIEIVYVVFSLYIFSCFDDYLS